jgi:hypothetical protein
VRQNAGNRADDEADDEPPEDLSQCDHFARWSSNARAAPAAEPWSG